MCLCLGQGRFNPYRAVEKGREGRATEPTFEGVWHALLPHRVWSAGESLRRATWLMHPPGLPGAAQQQHTWSAKVRKKKRSSFLFRGSSSSLNQNKTIDVHRTATQHKTVPAPRGASWPETGRKKPHKEVLFFPLHPSSDCQSRPLPVPSTPQDRRKQSLPQNMAKLGDTFLGNSFSVLEMYNTLMKERIEVSTAL